MPFCLALAMVYRKVTPDDFVDERLEEPQIQELIRRTRHLPKEEVLTVTLKDGKKLSEAFQPPTNLTQRSQVSEKFAHSVSQVFSPERTRTIADHVMRLEKLQSITELTNLLRTPDANNSPL